jgi:hypothetical protein
LYLLVDVDVDVVAVAVVGLFAAAASFFDFLVFTSSH